MEKSENNCRENIAKTGAILFLKSEPVSKKVLRRELGLKEDEVEEILYGLKKGLDDHGVTIVDDGSFVQMTTSERVAGFVEEFSKVEASVLTAAAKETLSLIAYRGPVAKYEIDTIRGVDSRHIIRQLLIKGLIQKSESKDKDENLVGRYDISIKFMRHLGISSKEQLPRFHELSSNEKIAEILNQQRR